MTGELVQMAVSYADDGGLARVRLCRNGQEIGDYTKGPLVTWSPDNDPFIVLGPLVSNPQRTVWDGGLRASFEEIRIYDVALDCDEVRALTYCGEVTPGDNCPNVPNPDQADGDGDGVGDACAP